jgi:hypothetical protein
MKVYLHEPCSGKNKFSPSQGFYQANKEVHIMRALSPVAATLQGDDPTRGDDPIDAFAWARRTLAVAVVQPPVDKSSLPRHFGFPIILGPVISHFTISS